jgi:type VI secretion system protein ImpC
MQGTSTPAHQSLQQREMGTPQYVILDDDASKEAKASHPLREARIDVVDVPGKPGAYRAVAFLKPHFQLDELSVSLRLVADLPPPAKG